MAAACWRPPPALAQYRVDQWTTDHGLPQNSVLALAQTRDGYLWAATLDGLVRFDGLRFVVFDKATTPGLSTNRFCALFEAADGTLWIGTEDRGVVRYRAGAFESFGAREGVPDPWVWHVQARDDGAVVLFTPAGAAVFDGGRFRPIGPQERHAPPARWAPGTQLSASGLTRFDGRTVVSRAYPPGVRKADVTAVLEDNRGALWLATSAGTHFRAAGDGWVAVDVDRRAAPVLRSVHTGPDGRYWVPTESGVLVLGAEAATEHVDLFPQTPGEGAFAMLVDREQSLWLGSVRHGLFRVRPRLVAMVGREEGLVDDNVYPVTEDAAGRTWIGTWRGGLHRLSPAGMAHWDERSGLPGRIISALHADADGGVVVGVLHHGIVTIGPDDRVRDPVAAALPDRVVSAIVRDRDGRLWLGTNGGLAVVRGTTVERVVTRDDGLPDQRVRALMLDRAGRLWVGTSNGVAVVDGARVAVPPGADALASDHVRAFHEDEQGTIWVGTADAGLVRLRDGRATRYTTAHGLASNGVFAMLDDGAGGLWTSSNLGLARVERRELDEVAAGRIAVVTARSFTRADGLRALEANGGRQPAAVRGRDGRLWFATSRGVAIVDPSRIAPAVTPLAPVVERVVVDGRVRARPAAAEVAPGEGHVSIEYGVGLLASPETVRFRVRLLGHDDTWRDVGAQRSMSYSRLRPGVYTFEVAAVSGGRVGPSVALPLQVKPRFYETRTFVAVAGASPLAVVAFVALRRRAAREATRRREREFARELLASQDRERKRLAADVHDGLWQHLLVIRNQALLAGTAPARAPACLASIGDTAAQAIDEVRTLAAALHPATLERLGLVRALRAMVRTLSESTAVAIVLDAPEDRRLPGDAELQVYRIVQESLSNALRHANATEVVVRLAFADRHLDVLVQDNGQGFDTGHLAQRERGSLGLGSIRERARALAADVAVDSAPGRGTAVRLCVPVAHGHRLAPRESVEAEDRP